MNVVHQVQSENIDTDFSVPTTCSVYLDESFDKFPYTFYVIWF